MVPTRPHMITVPAATWPFSSAWNTTTPAGIHSCRFLSLDYFPQLPLWFSPPLHPVLPQRHPIKEAFPDHHRAIAKLAPLKSASPVSSSEHRLLLVLVCVSACGIVCFPHLTQLHGGRDIVWVPLLYPQHLARLGHRVNISRMRELFWAASGFVCVTSALPTTHDVGVVISSFVGAQRPSYMWRRWDLNELVSLQKPLSEPPPVMRQK